MILTLIVQHLFLIIIILQCQIIYSSILNARNGTFKLKHVSETLTLTPVKLLPKSYRLHQLFNSITIIASRNHFKATLCTETILSYFISSIVRAFPAYVATSLEPFVVSIARMDRITCILQRRVLLTRIYEQRDSF